jgi:hypothetical protein
VHRARAAGRALCRFGAGRPVPIEQVFVLVSSGRRYLVVAHGMWIQENDLPGMTSSLVRA